MTLWTLVHCPWDSPGKNIGVGCHVLLQGIFLTRGLNLTLLNLLHWQTGSLPLVPHEKPQTYIQRQWHPTPVLLLLPGKSHVWRSLAGRSPQGCEESDTTEWLHFRFSLSYVGEGNGNPLQCSCLENPRDGGAWWAAVYRVIQSRTQLKWLSSSSMKYVPHMPWHKALKYFLKAFYLNITRMLVMMNWVNLVKQSPSWGHFYHSVQFSSVSQSCPTLCDPMNCSTPGLPVHHQVREFTQTHVHRVSDTIQPAISSSVVPFSSCPQSLPASGSFPMSQLFAWGGQSIGVSASASVLPMNTQDWSPLGWTGWISLQSKGLSIIRHDVFMTYSGKGRLALTQCIHICLALKHGWSHLK